MKISSKLIPFFSLLFVFCSPQQKGDINREWVAAHIFIDGKEILENDFKKTGWFPKSSRTKPFYIGTSDPQLNILLGGNEDKPIRADFSNGAETFKIFNSTDVRFNGDYKKDIKTDTVMQEGIKTVYYFLTLESDKNKILAVRSESVFR
jgi:hypothetical protein